MKKKLFYSTHDNTAPESYMIPEVFSTDRYDGMQLYNNQKGGKAILHRSDRVSPMPWCLFLGAYNTVFFRTYQEVQDYCIARGLKPISRRG